VQGQVVSRQNAPAPFTTVTLVQVSKPGFQHRVSADATGRFDVMLPPGSWLVYTRSADGRDVFQCRIEVRQQQLTSLRVLAP
jgi:hypothetical protein